MELMVVTTVMMDKWLAIDADESRRKQTTVRLDKRKMSTDDKWNNKMSE